MNNINENENKKLINRVAAFGLAVAILFTVRGCHTKRCQLKNCESTKGITRSITYYEDNRTIDNSYNKNIEVNGNNIGGDGVIIDYQLEIDNDNIINKKGDCSPTPVMTPKATCTPKPVITPKATSTPKPVITPKATSTPKPIITPTPTAVITSTPTPVVTSTPTSCPPIETVIPVGTPYPISEDQPGQSAPDTDFPTETFYPDGQSGKYMDDMTLRLSLYNSYGGGIRL